MKTTILGAGLAGLSTSWHIGHENCVIFEKSLKYGGHAGSESKFGFTYDHGPHVSFTKHAYVRELFEKNTNGEWEEYPVRTRNYYQGSWIEHPAQAHLWQVPEPIRNRCAKEMISAANSTHADVSNYADWLRHAYGETFAETFPSSYTRKYWTVDPVMLTTDWLGPRMPKLNVDEITKGLEPDTYQNLHYISKIRYPSHGGYQSFFDCMHQGAEIHFNQEIASINLREKKIWFSDGESHRYEKMISTLPLTDFINRCQDVPVEVRDATAQLDCSQLLIVDVFSPQEQMVPGHWFYVYDEDKWSTRIHVLERLAKTNSPFGWTGVQCEVYFSKHKPILDKPEVIAQQVLHELVEMGFIDEENHRNGLVHIQWRWSPYANVIFTHPRRQALDCIWSWLEQFGLQRENDDLEPMTDWSFNELTQAELAMAGRFAQWKYFWTDDCILRGKHIANNICKS